MTNTLTSTLRIFFSTEILVGPKPLEFATDYDRVGQAQSANDSIAAGGLPFEQ